MRLLIFTAWRRWKATLSVLGLCSLLFIPAILVRLAPTSATLTVQLVDLPDPNLVESIQVFAGACVLAETAPSPSGSARFALPAGTYTVTAASDALGREVGWITDQAVVHLDGSQTVRLGATIGQSSDLDAVRPPLPSHCATRTTAPDRVGVRILVVPVDAVEPRRPSPPSAVAGHQAATG
jgi:hypothetical protein